MRPHKIILGLFLLALASQLGSAQAADCDEIWVDADDISIERNETDYFYFQIVNNSEQDFQVYEAQVWKRTGDYDIRLVDWPNEVRENDEGELTVRVETGPLDERSVGESYVKVRGEFEDGTYCGFTHIGNTYFDVTVEEGDTSPECREVTLEVSDVYMDEDSRKTVSFTIENDSDEDFDVYDIEVEEDSPYLEAELYSKPSEVGAFDEETFRIRIESDTVSRDRQGDITVKVRGRFESGEYCPYSDTEEEEFTVHIDNTSGSTHYYECSDITLNTNTVRLEQGETEYATFFLENDASENFLIDYARVFDSSSNIRAEENGYAKLTPDFGNSYLNVRVKAYEHAETGTDEAFVEVKGHFQNGNTCYIQSKRFPVIIEEKEEETTEEYTESCSYFSLIVPSSKTMQEEGTVPITIDNRSMYRATIRLSGPGLTVQPTLISVPKNTQVSENISVSSVLSETSLIYTIEALGCNKTEVTSITATGIEEQEETEGGTEQENIEDVADDVIAGIPAGFYAIGQASVILGLLVLIGTAIYFTLKP